MLGSIRRFFVRDFGPPPPPDVTQLPSFAEQRIVETTYSESKRQRVFITLDETGDYRVYFQWWDTGDWQAGVGARWSYAHGSGSHTDSLERARDIADETLRCSRHDA